MSENIDNVAINENLINSKRIFINKNKNPINENKINGNYKTETNYLKSLQQKKKFLKISTNDEIFGFYQNKIHQYIQRPNKKSLSHNNVEAYSKTFSFNKENSFDKDEKSLELIEKFADNFKNKERSESLKNVLNMYKRYKSLSSMYNKNKCNNSYTSIHIIKNRAQHQKEEKNIINDIKTKDNNNDKKINNIKEISLKKSGNNNKNINNSKIENKENVNLSNTNKEKNAKVENKNKKERKYFMRKVVREEKCYVDKSGKIHVVGFKQSLIDDKNKINSKKKEKNKVVNKCSKNKKINVEINQINNINSYNNINDINSINKLKQNTKKVNSIFDTKEYINLTEHNEPANINSINLSRKIPKNNLNYKYYENKLKFLPKKIAENNINNNISFDRITHRTVHSYGKNYSYHYSYKNPKLYQDKIIDIKKFNAYNPNQDYFGYNNINEYNYKNYNNLYYNSDLFAQNYNNCSYYESKSLSNFKEKLLKHNNSHIEFFRNNIFDVNYSNMNDNDNLYEEDLNNKTFFNSYYFDNIYNKNQNFGKISSYRLIRVPKYNN